MPVTCVPVSIWTPVDVARVRFASYGPFRPATRMSVALKTSRTVEAPTASREVFVAVAITLTGGLSRRTPLTVYVPARATDTEASTAR